MQSGLRSEIAPYIQLRASTAVGPLWRLSSEVIPGILPAVLLGSTNNSQPFAFDSPSTGEYDKLAAFFIHEQRGKYRIRGRMYDTFVQLWSPVYEQEVARLQEVPETAFMMLCELFTPVARFRVHPENEQLVNLEWKGASLPTPRAAHRWVQEGDLLIPVLRRTDSDGVPVEDGVQQVPWTYLQITEQRPEESIAQVYSHTRRPFGVRRRGSIDQVALVVRPSGRSATLRLHARGDSAKPLVGLEIYRQYPGEEDMELIGTSGTDGTVDIRPDSAPLQILFIKSGSQPVAKLPIVSGAQEVLEVPLVDDQKRLEAEAKVNAIREELIDLVARRTILASRIRKAIEDEDLDQAKTLLEELHALPGAGQFSQRLESQSRLVTADDPQVQKRIDRLFDETRMVLGRFLDANFINVVDREVAEARK